MSCRFRRADPFQCLSFRFEIGPGVVIGGVEAHMTKPAADDGNVDACRDEVYGGGVSEAVRRHMFNPQRRRGFARPLPIGRMLEPNAGCARRLTIAVDEQPLVRRSRLSL